MKNKILLCLSLILCSMFQACEQDDIMYYEGGNAVHFIAASYSTTFLTHIEDETDIIQVPVQLVGNIQDKDLEFAVEVVNDEEKTTATPEQYNIISCIVPAGETTGYMKIEVKNPDKLNTTAKTLKLRLKLIDKDGGAKAGGWRDFLEIDVLWSSDWIKPATWSGFYYFVCQKYSPAMHKAYVAATGYTECYYTTTKIVDPETGDYWYSDKCRVMGKKFGDWIRKWNEENAPLIYCHDGDYEGEPVVPIY